MDENPPHLQYFWGFGGGGPARWLPGLLGQPPHLAAHMRTVDLASSFPKPAWRGCCM